MQEKDFEGMDSYKSQIDDRFENTYKKPDEIEEAQQARHEKELEKEESKKCKT